MKHSQHQNLIGFLAVVDAIWEALDKGLSHCAVDDWEGVGLLGDSIKESLHRFYKTRSKSSLLSFIPFGRFIEFNTCDTAKDDRNTRPIASR